MADARHDAPDEIRRAGVVETSEAERVHHRHRARTHGEDVANDAADTGRGALVGLDVGRVVVALHLEDRRVAVTDPNVADPASATRELGLYSASICSVRPCSTLSPGSAVGTSDLDVAIEPGRQLPRKLVEGVVFHRRQGR